MTLRLLVGTLILVLAGQLAASDGDFRCDTEIFIANEKQPVHEGLTIFKGEVVYDFLLSAPHEITIYDFRRGHFTLLDKNRKVKTTIASDDLLRFTAAYRTIKPESEVFSFSLQPSFDEEFAAEVLTLRSKVLTYRVNCSRPELAGAEKRYREFADWSARLNAIRPGNLPPFPRMEMNKSLAARGLLPTQIERTITTSHLTGKRVDLVKSRHLFNWTLSLEDERRIEKAGDYLTQFAPVTPEDYLEVNKGAKTAAK